MVLRHAVCKVCTRRRPRPQELTEKEVVMPAGVQSLPSALLQSQPRRRVTDGQTSEELVRMACLLGGGGLLGWGLLRGSWSGLALACAGGFLVHRALNQPALSEARRGTVAPAEEAPSAPEWAGGERFPSLSEAGRGNVASPAAVSPARGPERAAVPQRGNELSPEEHAEAKVAAYFRALERGGGWLPTYDPERTAEDFCWAAGVVRGRRGGDGRLAARERGSDAAGQRRG